MDCESLLLWIANQSSELFHATIRVSPPSTNEPTATAIWSAPGVERRKFNVDAAFRGGQTVLGVVLRNNFGTVEGIWTKRALADSPLEGELMAFKLALEIAGGSNMDNFDLEGDNQQVIRAAQSLIPASDWVITPLFLHVFKLLASFHSVNCFWIP